MANPSRHRARLLRCVLAAAAIAVFTQPAAAFDCPSGQYPYGSCSSCFTIPNNERLNFDGARQRCIQLGGNLVTTENEKQLNLLSRYLSGLQQSGRHWIGYRLSSTGSRIGLHGDQAPEVVRNDDNFDGSTSGSGSSCIGIENGKFVVSRCTESLPFICTITYSAPSAVKQPNNDIVYAAPQRDVQLQATVTETGIKFVEWKFNGMGIIQGENGVTVSKSNETPTGLVAMLIIGSYNSTRHLGKYELLVTSQTGTATVASWLLRNAVIQLTLTPSDLSIPQGQLAAFECNAAGSKPRAEVMWYKDSAPISNRSDPRVYVSPFSGTLMIRESQPSDAGLYQCAVENMAGMIRSREARLEVITSNAAYTTQFILNPHNLTVLTGESYSVECSAAQTATDSATITVHDHRAFDVSVMSYTYPETPGFPVYAVQSATLEEPRCYYCAFVTVPFAPQHLEASEKSFVTVHASALVESISTIRNGTRTQDTHQSVSTGETSVLECEFSGVPIPDTVEWTRDGNSITEGIVMNNNASSLTVRRDEMSSIYQCHVENVYGTDTRTVFQCTKREEDGIPGHVIFTAEPDTNTSVYIQWGEATPPRTHPLLLRYEILFRDVDSNASVTFGPFLSTQFNYTMTDLEPNTEYVISVIATSLAGGSEGSNQSVNTFANPPSETVTNITAKRNDNNTVLIVQWVPYRTPDGKTVSMATYDIEYRVSGSKDSTVTNVNGNSTLGIVSGLRNASSYEVRVRVTVQVARNPPQYASSDWSDYVLVQGITTLPVTPTPPSTEGVSVGSSGLTEIGLLLLIIFLSIVVVLMVVALVFIIVVIMYCFKKHPRGGKYTVRRAAEIRQQRLKNSKGKGPQTPMRDEVFTLQSSLPTSPTPPPVLDGNRNSATFLEGTDRVGVAHGQENGINASIVSSSPRSVSPLPLPPPNPDFENPYILTAEFNHYTLEPFSHQIDPFVSPIVNVGYTDEVHDLSSSDFQKLNISEIFEAGTPEVFDRLEGFEPVHTMPTFDIITTGGEGGDSRDQSPATTTSLVNQTPEPQSDHRVTFAPAVITISPEPYTNEVFSAAMGSLNTSNCNNNERVTATAARGPPGGDGEIFNFPPVAEIVEGEELSGQVERYSTILL